jgi:hypothetical protein
MQRELLILGIVIIVVALAWPWLSKLPFGKLPGDIAFSRPGFRFYAPITTMIILSVVLSLALWLFRR